MVDFLGKQDLPLFGPLAFGDIDDDTAKPYQTPLFVEVRNRRAGAPANLAVWTNNAEFGLEGVGVFRKFAESANKELEVIAIDERLHTINRWHENARFDAENLALALVPDGGSAGDIPLPAPHLACGEGEAAQTFGLSKLTRRGGKGGRAFGNARLKLTVELLELSCLAEQLDEDLDLCAQHLGNDRHRDVI